MGYVLLKRFEESLRSVLPICAIVVLLHLTLTPLPTGTMILFAIGAVLLIVGMSAFTQGADMAVMPMGELIGSKLTESRNVWLIILTSFVLGAVLTAAEPDLQVLTRQIPAIPDPVFVATVAFGVGIFLVLAVFRILLRVRLSYTFVLLYSLVFLLAAFTGLDYLAVAFDSSGVTTGPITVPFILAMGAGISAVRGEKRSEDSFGLTAICSIGPILAVLILGLFFDPAGTGYAYEPTTTVSSTAELARLYAGGLIQFLREVSLILLPIVVIFSVYQVVHLRLSRTQLIQIGVGIVYILFGLTVFLTGVNIGFVPAGIYLGHALTSLPYNWILVPLGAVIGFFIVAAEPAVQILVNQIDEITSGAISRRIMLLSLSVSVGVALALVMVRVLTEIEIWLFLLPGYAVALALTFVAPQIFVAIAFDSGGIAAGTMAAAFLLPFTTGVSRVMGGSVLTEAFGIITVVAMMPLITVQVMGLIYKMKVRRVRAMAKAVSFDREDTDIIDL
ncbi:MULTISPECIES: DUF1538 domain-containing protein [Methanoculleus]|uniref:DUF1538 domain-containing protein n=1 Tax=Methanoculleus thermophilus TaxID=2200 RepID=A0A1G8YMB8_9EURY|nr:MULTISPECIES: DUF1538 domain-containing protein [Methanoculleus]NLN08264.1 DUF1538 domain-containing protein [Methanoculleus thermophilus]SDK03979.1 Protein of unknown function [Methanoculleus thermophilus]HQD25563.1 DUF1538 domain-containing protein [Methanoculleus thermophilus]